LVVTLHVPLQPGLLGVLGLSPVVIAVHWLLWVIVILPIDLCLVYIISPRFLNRKTKGFPTANLGVSTNALGVIKLVQVVVDLPTDVSDKGFPFFK
jgi:hypothetical protein